MSSPPPEVDAPLVPRPLRADARRNRERIVEAGRAAFAERGGEAQMEDVARRAGVGVGTVYRHFPSRDALIEGIAVAHFAAVAEDTVASAADVTVPAWDAFSGLIWRSGQRMTLDAGLAEIAANHPQAMETAAMAETGMRTATAALMARAVAEGSMRPDATIADVRLMMCGLGILMATKSRAAGLSWERYLTLMLDGLRVDAARLQ